MSSRHTQTSTPLAWPSLAPNPKLFQAATQFQANAAKAVMRYQIEALSFLQRRCEADMKLLDDLTRSRDVTDAVDVMGRFVQNSASDYMSEVSRLASTGTQFVSQAVEEGAAVATQPSKDAKQAAAA